MQISVSGKNFNAGSSLSDHAKERLEYEVTKYFDHAVHASVVFTKEAHLYRVDIHVNEGTGTGIIIKSTANADDVYISFAEALSRIEKQLRRYKKKIKNHHRKKGSELAFEQEVKEAVKYVLSPFGEETDDVDSHHDNDEPLIIAEKSAKVEKLTVSEAVMKMDLQQLPALMFINAKNNRLNIVYHRADGNISWVDPQ
jgi:ribosomal subunit interface protein